MEKIPTKNKIESIQNQIEKLKAQKLKVQRDLEKSQHAKIISLIKKENGFSHDFHVLIGALSEAIKSLNHVGPDSEKCKNYETMGKDFLDRNKKNTTPKN